MNRSLAMVLDQPPRAMNHLVLGYSHRKLPVQKVALMIANSWHHHQHRSLATGPAASMPTNLRHRKDRLHRPAAVVEQPVRPLPALAAEFLHLIHEGYNIV